MPVDFTDRICTLIAPACRCQARLPPDQCERGGCAELRQAPRTVVAAGPVWLPPANN